MCGFCCRKTSHCLLSTAGVAVLMACLHTQLTGSAAPSVLHSGIFALLQFYQLWYGHCGVPDLKQSQDCVLFAHLATSRIRIEHGCLLSLFKAVICHGIVLHLACW